MQPHNENESYPAYQPPATPEAEDDVKVSDSYQAYKEPGYHPAVEEVIVTDGEDIGRVKDPNLAHEMALEGRFVLLKMNREKELGSIIKYIIAHRATELSPQEDKDKLLEQVLSKVAGIGISLAEPMDNQSMAAASAARTSLGWSADDFAKTIAEAIKDYNTIQAKAKEFHRDKKLSRPGASKRDRIQKLLINLNKKLSATPEEEADTTAPNS